MFGFTDDITAWQYFRQFLVDGYVAFEIIYDDKGKNVYEKLLKQIKREKKIK